MQSILKALTLAGLVAVASAAAPPARTFVSKPFVGPKANTGAVTATVDKGQITLQVSEDFVIPDTPAPSWQIVDSKGDVYLLKQFRIKNGTNRMITLPSYIKDVAKVQVWCSFAEVVLGETTFETIVK